MNESRRYATVDELESDLGKRLRAIRLDRNWDQSTLAGYAGVGLNSLRRLELGQGSTMHTLISVLRALGRTDWLATIAPVATINPVTMTAAAKPRQRAARATRKHSNG